MEPGRRRSLLVNLTALGVAGAVAVPYLPQGNELRRNVYADRESCVRDYSPDQCEPPSSSSAVGHGSWRGPGYYSDRSLPEAKADPGAGRIGLSGGTETSVRGGFGRIGQALRAVG
jgi:hypothetical protein